MTDTKLDPQPMPSGHMRCARCEKIVHEADEHVFYDIENEGHYQCSHPKGCAVAMRYRRPASEPAKAECNHHWDGKTRLCVYCRLPQPEPAKAECPNCGEVTDQPGDHRLNLFDEQKWICQPAQPEPVAAEMPGAVAAAIEAITDAYDETDDGYRCVDGLRDWWRTHAAQPAKVRMTEELERLLVICEEKAIDDDENEAEASARFIRADIAAVRAQAAEAGKVRMPKVRAYLERQGADLKRWTRADPARHFIGLDAALAELDAVEGKGEGRG